MVRFGAKVTDEATGTIAPLGMLSLKNLRSSAMTSEERQNLGLLSIPSETVVYSATGRRAWAAPLRSRLTPPHCAKRVLLKQYVIDNLVIM